ncbi:unnamed protein product, partial [Symbiodinium microadriaticum]
MPETMAELWQRREYYRRPRYVKRCMEENPTTFLTATIIGSLALVVTMIVCLRHSRALDARPFCLLRSSYHGMLAFPTVWACCCWLTLFTPLSTPIAELFMGQGEAFAIYSFMVILFMLVSVEAMKQGEGVEIDEPSSPSSRTSQVSLRQSIIQTLQKFGPQKYFTVPPFGCCFRPCVKPHHITAKQLLWVSRLVRQYVVMQVFVNAYFMWARFTLDPYWEVDAVADPLLKVSGMVAMYGLFVMYAATHELLHRWNTTRKFISVKAMVALSILQQKFLGLLVPLLAEEKNCWVDPEHPEETERLVHFWVTFATLL